MNDFHLNFLQMNANKKPSNIISFLNGRQSGSHLNIRHSSWKNTLSKSDWHTWMASWHTYPETKSLDYIAKNSLIIQKNRPTINSIEQKAHLVKTLKINPTADIHTNITKTELYKKMLNIEKLQIIGANRQIDFINSKKLTHITVSGKQDNEDFILKLLKGNTNLIQLSYAHGNITTESCIELQKNKNLKTLHFVNVQMNENSYEDFHEIINNNADTLKFITLRNSSIYFQIAILNKAREGFPIKDLILTLDAYLRNLYQNLQKLTKLENITLQYTDPELMQTLLPTLILIPTLKTISLQLLPEPGFDEPLSIDYTYNEEIVDIARPYFTNRNVEIIQKGDTITKILNEIRTKLTNMTNLLNKIEIFNTKK